MIKLCIFDLDDTLIDTAPLYRSRQEDFAQRMVSLGFEHDEAVALRNEIDREAVAKQGVPITRFPQSFHDTYKALCLKYNIPFDPEIAQEVRELGASVFNAFSPLFSYSSDVLEEVANKYHCVLLTRGDKTVQLQRVLAADIANYFDNIFVVERKTPQIFESICRYYDIASDEAVMIGNSMVGDIIPALEAELFAIFAPNGTSEIESVESFPPIGDVLATHFYKCKDIQCVPDLLSYIEEFKKGL